jgi:glutamyl-tRNA synthetase
VQTRVEVLGDVPAMVEFLFKDVDPMPLPPPDPAAPAAPPVELAALRLAPLRPTAADWAKAMAPPAAALLDDVIGAYDHVAPWTADALKGELEVIGERHGLKLGKAQAPVRMAVTARTVGPPLFESLEALGHDVVLARLRAARAKL